MFRNPAPSGKEWALSALLFSATSVTTTVAGLAYFSGPTAVLHLPTILSSRPESIAGALQFSIPLMTILLAHELGHFFACRYYGIHCTPPFFIPTPFPYSGTFGAFIKIKSSFGTKRSLFDVGIAGPLAGFIVTVIVLWNGIRFSRIGYFIPAMPGTIEFGEPAIFRFLGTLLLDYDPSRHVIFAHPAAIAGTFGLLLTCLNLLPIWQLDGGHLAYAVFGPNLQKKISAGVLALLMLAGLSEWQSPSYLVFGLVLFFLGYRVHFSHPATLRDWEPVGPGRTVLAFIALLILILCFTPVPVKIW
ncbi:MAG: site-2 protease family protein [Acidobacteria bacterium]|nr:site-2 protease family protein [Acidobacteriota bacterium]